MSLDTLRLRLLAARDQRAALIARMAAALPDGHALVFLSLNVPGPEKFSPLLERLFQRTRAVVIGEGARKSGGLRHTVGVDRRSAGPAEAGAAPHQVAEGRDALGPWLAAPFAGRPADVKRACIRLEDELPAGRLIDLDVLGADGAAIPRRALDLPPRRCLVCREPAVDCIRTGAHTAQELHREVSRLLHADECQRLADALVEGARIELELTPKPGLVDRVDNGSHPDLSFDLMSQSIDLLPQYYRELLDAATATRLDLDACVAAGRRAEQRMLDAVGSNAHRGYIFLSGLVLLGLAVTDRRDACPTERDASDAGRGAACSEGRLSSEIVRPDRAITAPEETGARRGMPPPGQDSDRRDACPTVLRESIARVARDIVAGRGQPTGTHGGEARRRHGIFGVIGEALNGLPAVFDHALPALERDEARVGLSDAALHRAMAVLMTVVEDTTALHRRGTKGLERLRQDGRRIIAAIDSGGEYVPLIEAINAEYRADGLTMGGVADCLAIAIGLSGRT